MKNIYRILGVSTLLFLGACSDKSAPSIASGSGDMKYIESSNVLDSDKNPMILGRADSISVVFTDSLSELSVKVSSNGMIPVSVEQDGAEIVIRPGSGIWEDAAYNVSITGTLPDGTPVAVSFTIQRELGLGVLKTNVYNLETNLGYQDVAADLEAIVVEFDREIEKVEDPTLLVGGVEVATTVSIDENVVSIEPNVESLGYNKSCQIVFRAVTADSQYVNVSYSFKTAGSDLVPVATNAEIVGSSVGSLTTDFPRDGTMWVKFNDSLDTDLTKLAWYNSSNANIDLYAGGSVGTINAIVEIVGDTLKVTPKEILKIVDNNSIVGFYVTVVSKKKLRTTVDVIAHVVGNQVHVVSTNVQQENGLYRPFAVIGDSLVVTFSEAIETASTETPFRVLGFVNNYSVKWSKDKMTATIKNVDTLMAANFGASEPYKKGNTDTRAYANVQFRVATVDGEVALVAPNDPIEIHTEFGLAIVDANITHKHSSILIPVGNTEEAMDTIAADGQISIVFNRAVDTAQIKSAIANTYFILYKGTEPTVMLPISLTFSKDALTVTITPDTELEARNGGYFIRVIKVPAKGIANAPAIGSHSGKASGTGTRDTYLDLLTTDALKVDYAAIDISKLKAAIGVDVTWDADAVFSAFYTYGNNIDASLSLQISKPAWNAKHSDSVDGYQLRVQKISRKGVKTGWYYYSGIIATDTYNTSIFATAGDNPVKKSIDLDLSAEAFYTNLRTPDMDGDGTDYTNLLGMFNDSARIEIQIRAVNDDDGDTKYESSGEVGVWSTSVILADNTAPCDQDFVGTSDIADASTGGVSIDQIGFDGEVIDGSGSGTIPFTIEITFAEDMNPVSTNKPAVKFFWATAPAAVSLPVLDADDSKWLDARTYRLVYNFKGTVDYSTLGGYYAIDVSGVKDGSGIVISGWGSTGTNNTTTDQALVDVVGDQIGSKNVLGLIAF